MTIQVADTILFDNTEFDVIDGFKPKSASTACMRGYWCKFRIIDRMLVLDKLYICCDENEYPENIKYESNPDGTPRSCMGCRICSNFTTPVFFSGKILVGNDLVNMPRCGYPPHPYEYKEVVELVFQDGRLISAINHGKVVKKIRRKCSKWHKCSSKYEQDITEKYWWLLWL